MDNQIEETGIKPESPPQPLDLLKVDEVKRYEKIYEISKDLFSYTESIVKNHEDKSRNNLTAATAIMGFTFLIRKPPDITNPTWYDVILLLCSVCCVGYIYYCHIDAVKPQAVKIPKKAQLEALRTETFYPQGVVRHNFETLQDIYESNLELIQRKAKFVKNQQIFLLFVLILSILYVLLGQIPRPTKDESGRVETSCPTTTSAPSHNPPPGQTLMPVQNPTTSTYTKEQTSGRTITAPVTPPRIGNDTSKP